MLSGALGCGGSGSGCDASGAGAKQLYAGGASNGVWPDRQEEIGTVKVDSGLPKLGGGAMFGEKELLRGPLLWKKSRRPILF